MAKLRVVPDPQPSPKKFDETNFSVIKRGHLFLQLLLIVVLFASPDPSSSPGSNKTDLATGRGSSLDSRCFANMLMVTTTVGMLNGVHSHTTNLGPAIALNLEFVIGTTSLKHGLVNTATTGYNANHGSVGRRDHLRKY